MRFVGAFRLECSYGCFAEIACSFIQNWSECDRPLRSRNQRRNRVSTSHVCLSTSPLHRNPVSEPTREPLRSRNQRRNRVSTSHVCLSSPLHRNPVSLTSRDRTLRSRNRVSIDFTFAKIIHCPSFLGWKPGNAPLESQHPTTVPRHPNSQKPGIDRRHLLPRSSLRLYVR